MQFAIPHAPRKVLFRQVPGAVGRLLGFLLLALVLAGGCVALARRLSLSVSADAARLARSEKIIGTFVEAKLPPKDKREDALGTMTVLYDFQKQRFSASGVATRADVAEGYGPGASVRLYVDPVAPDHPEVALLLSERVARQSLLPYGLWGGAVLGVCTFLFGLWRIVSRELEPLRKGMIVWLTPEGELPQTRREVTFRGHFFKQDVKLTVTARGRPGRAPVRNGDKVLAAVSPRWSGWARLVDEDLARALGWMRAD
ncbi:MAG: DUF3592 domain-containing protein [Myxococcaceae bacterium]